MILSSPLQGMGGFRRCGAKCLDEPAIGSRLHKGQDEVLQKLLEAGTGMNAQAMLRQQFSSEARAHPDAADNAGWPQHCPSPTMSCAVSFGRRTPLSWAAGLQSYVLGVLGCLSTMEHFGSLVLLEAVGRRSLPRPCIEMSDVSRLTKACQALLVAGVDCLASFVSVLLGSFIMSCIGRNYTQELNAEQTRRNVTLIENS